MSENDILKEYENEQTRKPDLTTTLDALKANESGRPDPTVFYGLSGLMPEEAEEIRPVWQELNAGYRQRVMRELIEASETNIEMDYRQIGFLGLNDPESDVRVAAVDVLWEDDSLELMSRLVHMARRDEVPRVRAAAVNALSRFILMGELGDLPEEEIAPAREIAVQLLTDPDEEIAVRRRALEAIANCGHEIVPGAIEEAYKGSNHEMRVSAIFAMGRTCDERWEDIVLAELENRDPEIRYEAARAAGELMIADAVPKLANLSLQNDREIKEVAIWSLGEIGGKAALRALNLLADKAEEDEDEVLLQAIEDAIGAASLTTDDPSDMWML